ncbi:MAG: hypothetical protein KIS92_20270 [Planctomycetota bacterium]|nr:hypothetical protein [Planctomycetota bacterium]
MVPNTNDGTKKVPYLRSDFNLGTLTNLPAWSNGPRGDDASKLAAIKAAGYQGVQGGNVKLCRELGLGVTGGGRINKVGEALPLAQQCKDAGQECATVHVAWGIEDDAEVFALVEDILNACAKTNFPIYIETHRATITQDPWRTVQFANKFPEVRFNGDFSHWYTGLEMVYGDFNAKLAFMAPVFERVRFIHGRIGNPGSMQVDCGDGTGRTYVDHFREMWKRCFQGFLKTAQPGDFICFAPELLHPEIYYARVFKNEKGEMIEESDRWEQAKLLSKVAREAFAAAAG